jgi:hypothetical protein
LNARTGAVVWTEYTAKTSELFLRLMETLMKTYRRARRLILIVDNYIIHKSRMTQGWLARHPKIQLLFQPVYHPWVNDIEKLWKKLHDTVTRNHRHTTMPSLMRADACGDLFHERVTTVSRASLSADTPSTLSDQDFRSAI